MTGWHPGDLSLSGIGLTACYGALAAGCFLIGRRSAGRPHPRHGTAGFGLWAIWNGLGAALAIVAIERQLGLFDLVTETMRVRAGVEGNYAFRQVRQVYVLKAVAVAAAVIGIACALSAKRAGWHAAALTIVVTLIVAYLTGKAVSLHAVDHLLFRRVGGIAIGNAIELGLAGSGAVIVALAFAASGRIGRSDPRRR